ncbi:MAG TPA: DNA polymerase/3'-5' exonuclease PolX [Burkholderiaceae bacterium]|nr:DNA polymerase/3'-5' exonuclease PolX [Burkholderiaceae bacterium]
MTNADIAAAFDQMADLLDLRNANPFRVRAYRNASRVVGGLKIDLAALIDADKELPKLPGIGADLEEKIRQLATSGHLPELDRLRKQVPAGLTDLLRVPGLGPRRVRVLSDALGLHSQVALLRAARDGRIRELRGFGPASEERIAAALEAQLSKKPRYKLAVAAQYADALCTYLAKGPGVIEVATAGSLRRARETVGDIDLLATAAEGGDVVRYFAACPDAKRVLASGATRGSIVLKSGLQVDLRVVPEESYGAALLYFTGSKAHNIRLRNLALERNLKLNEYGLFRARGRGREVGAVVAGRTEESVYAALGLPWIAPELREDRGEIEAARNGELPALIERRALRGDLHAHTTWSDGSATIEQMAAGARARGLEYLAISDHSRRRSVANGLDPERLARQCADIARFNARHADITLLTGIECDVLDDGILDLPDSALAPLEVVVAAIHSRFNLPRQKQTARVLAALDNPHVRILAHPVGRLIGLREPYDLDMQAVIRKCKARAVALELSAHPERLALQDLYCRMAKDEGVLVAINSDAHAVHEFDNLVYGVAQARRGWLEAGHVLNTRSLAQVRTWLRERR